ncbi:MAG TPA: TlyA family RNA methyltransferase [Nitrospiria bacterium]|nr:TlyA family RNA methyltransferase [Nitrospiria bacterium]
MVISPSVKKQVKKRLDRALVDRGLADSREKAQALILAGAVEVDGAKATKAGLPVKDGAVVRIHEDPAGTALRYVGRGGLKLEAAIDRFGITIRDQVAVDIGASTGGFTDCLLQRGAARVYAVDVGYGQLAWSLRRDGRVHVIDRTNIRFLEPGRIPEPVDLATIDVSFISLTKVLPKAAELVRPNGMIVALVKPQFEVGKGEVGKGGVVRDPAKRESALNGIVRFARSTGLIVKGVMPSPITGQKGNVEYLILLEKP